MIDKKLKLRNFTLNKLHQKLTFNSSLWALGSVNYKSRMFQGTFQFELLKLNTQMWWIDQPMVPVPLPEDPDGHPMDGGPE